MSGGKQEGAAAMANLTVERVNVTEQVIEYLKSNIQRGIWKPGDRIASENELTAVLSVSRASVRHAIQQLIAVGVLESYQGKGTYVKTLPIETLNENFDHLYVNTEILQLMEFRTILEEASCRLAAERITGEGLHNLEFYYSRMKEVPRFSDEFIKYDMEFHMEILRATKNGIVVRSMEHVIQEIQRQQELLNTEAGVSRAIRYHGEILEALKHRDGNRAAEQMAEHLSQVYQVEDGSL